MDSVQKRVGRVIIRDPTAPPFRLLCASDQKFGDSDIAPLTATLQKCSTESDRDLHRYHSGHWTLFEVDLASILRNCSNEELVVLTPPGNPMVNTLDTTLSGLGYNVSIMASDAEIDAAVRDEHYGNPNPKFCFGISISETGPNYKYKLRFNTTNVRRATDAPPTEEFVTSDLRT